jgi:hypothetical protein
VQLLVVLFESDPLLSQSAAIRARKSVGGRGSAARISVCPGVLAIVLDLVSG